MHYLRAMRLSSRTCRITTGCLGAVFLVVGFVGGFLEWNRFDLTWSRFLDVATPAVQRAPAPGIRAPGALAAATSRTRAGTVVDQDGLPLTGVTLRFIKPGEDLPRLTVTSDAEGRFEVPTDKDTIFRVMAEKAGYHSDGEHWTSLGEGGLLVHLEAAAGLRIEAVLQNGNPAPAATLRVMGSSVYPPLELTTDRNGQAVLPDLAPGILAIEAVFEDQVAELVGVELTAGQTVVAHLYMDEGIFLHGLVRDEKDDRPLAGALFTLGREEPSLLTRLVETGEDGRFRIGPLPEGGYRFSLSAQGFVSLTGRRFWVGKTSGLALFELSRGVTITGRVVDSAGRPVERAGVECWGVDATGTLIAPLSLDAPGLIPVGQLGVTDKKIEIGQTASGAVTTDEKGMFTLTGIPSGQLMLHVSHENFLAASVVIGEITQSTDVPDIRLTPGAELTLLVVDERQFPVIGAQLRVESARSPGTGFTAFTDENGEVTLPAVGAEFTATFFHPEFPVQVEQLKGVRHQKVQLKRGTQTMRLRLRDAARIPVMRAQVELFAQNRPEHRQRTTDDTGTVVFERLGPGPYLVVVTHPDYTPMEKTGVEPGEYDWTVPYGGGFQGFVRDKQTLEALAGTVRLSHPDGQTAEQETRKGEVEFRGLAEGTWRVHVSVPGYSPVTSELVVTSGSTLQDLNLAPQLWELSRAGAASGTVRDDRGFPVRGAWVTAGPFVEQSDRSGNFSFKSLPAGENILVAWHPLSGMGSETIHIIADLQAPDVIIDLVPARTTVAAGVSGLTLTRDPLRSRLVAAIDAGSPAARAGLVDGESVWRIGGLPSHLPLFMLRSQLTGPAGTVVFLEVGPTEWLARPVFIRLE